jgi:hypothetical protein
MDKLEFSCSLKNLPQRLAEKGFNQMRDKVTSFSLREKSGNEKVRSINDAMFDVKIFFKARRSK